MSCGCKGYGAATINMEDTTVLSVAVLGRGIVHPDVVLLRRKLNEKVPNALDSLTSNQFDWDLEFVLNGYQYANSLPQTGLADKQTWAKLLGVSEDALAVYDPAKKAAPPSGSSGGIWLVAVAAAAWWALS